MDLSLLRSPLDPARAAQNICALQEHNQRQNDGAAAAGSEIRSVGVIGAGVMGSGIAAWHLRHGVPVAVSDAAPEALARAVPLILDEAARAEVGAPVDPQAARALAPLLHASTGYEGLAPCDCIIESVVETRGVKQQIYQRVEPQIRSEAILASNTSTFSIGTLAQSLQRAEQFCGLHFFNPIHEMPLVEVVRGPRTSPATVATAVRHLRRLGKMPIVVADSPGFLVNRMLAPYLNEALQLLSEGVSVPEIDAAATAFGMSVGPLRLLDLIGIDTAIYAGFRMWEAFPDRIAVSPILPAFMRAGRLGQKSGRGFYSYQAGPDQPAVDPAAASLVEQYLRPRPPLDQLQVTARLFLPVIVEATRVLESGLVRDARDVDLGLVFGLAFPTSKGGLLFWADSIGLATIVRWLRPLEALGARFQPSELLLSLAAANRRFYD